MKNNNSWAQSFWAKALGVSDKPAGEQQQGSAVSPDGTAVSDASAAGTQEKASAPVNTNAGTQQEITAPVNTAAGTATEAQGQPQEASAPVNTNAGTAVNNTAAAATETQGAAGTATETPAANNTNAGTQQEITAPTGGSGATSSSLHETEQSITEPTGGETETKPAYLADWSTANFNDVVNNGDKSIAEYISDFNRWARDNGQEPLDVMQIYNAVKNRDISKSAQANEKEEKKLQRQQRWEQIGNLLQHLGNFVGTLNNAPGAKYEDANELTERQQKVRDDMLKQRGDPKSILNLLWKDRAAKSAADVAAANKKYKDALAKKAADDAAANKKKADAYAGLKGAQTETEKAKPGLINAKKGKIVHDDKRAGRLQPLKEGKLRSAIGLDKARAKQARAAAKKNIAQAKKAAGGDGYSDAEFEKLYSDPKYRKFFNAYATNNHMDVEDNISLGKGGGTWSDKKTRTNALKWAKEARRREIEAERKKAIAEAKKRREQTERQRKAAADTARRERAAAQARAKREQTNKNISESLNKPRTRKSHSLGLHIGKTR